MAGMSDERKFDWRNLTIIQVVVITLLAIVLIWIFSIPTLHT